MTHQTTKLRNRICCTSFALLTTMLSSCATVDPQYADERDPFESFNRSMFTFNDNLDRHVAKPLARGYQKITPAPVDRGITNFFSNLDEVGNVLNNTLQWKLKDAATDLGRLGINSTIGILGFFDPASKIGLQKHYEDFGQTLGRWGIGAGPYLVLPIIGPSSTRDAVGFAGDWFTNPLYYAVDDMGISLALYTMRFVDRRADLLETTDLLETAALDPYAFLREAYLQRRQNQVYDGNPPMEDFFIDE